jgi:hypothetical protein
MDLPAEAARRRIEAALADLDDIIREICGTAFALRPPQPAPPRSARRSPVTPPTASGRAAWHLSPLPVRITERRPGGTMRARVGDTLMVKERRAGEGDREAVILEVRSEHGRPPYAVRWDDDSENAFFGLDLRYDYTDISIVDNPPARRCTVGALACARSAVRVAADGQP